jgi:membrane-bound serine protease (ClpP class)
MTWRTLLLGVLMVFSVGTTNAQADNPLVVVATVENEITAGTVQYVKRTIAEAERVGADLFVLEIDTPGGLLKATEEISRALVDAQVPTAVFVHKETGKALSAGVYILLSADTAAATPHAIIGAATPITGGGDDATEKIINASAEWLGVLANRNNRTVEEIKDFVFNASTMAAGEANEKGIIDIVAISTRDMVQQLGYEEPIFSFLKPRWTDSFLGFLSLPFLVPLLLSLGAVGIFLMFRTGDIESIGIIGIVFLFLGLWGAGTITISTLGLLLLITGLSLLVVEFLFSPGFGIVGGVGALALIISTITFANEPLYPNYLNSHLFYSVLGVWAGFVLIMGWLGSLSMSALKQPIQVGREAWYGKVIVLESALTPEGRIYLEGDSYLARTVDNTIIESGTSVTIVKIEGNTILVTLTNK